jgi:IS30 family transposase
MIRKDKPDPRKNPLTAKEKSIIYSMNEEGQMVKDISLRLGRNHSVISRFIKKYISTEESATRLFKANAEKIAKRVIADADVDQDLEVLDRINVLSKQREAPSTQFNIMVGMPGKAVLAPSQQRVIEAKVAESK